MQERGADLPEDEYAAPGRSAMHPCHGWLRDGVPRGARLLQGVDMPSNVTRECDDRFMAM